jgi:hypothetical protein
MATHFESLEQLIDRSFLKNCLPYDYFTSSFVKVNVKFTAEQTRKVQRGSRGIALLFL